MKNVLVVLLATLLILLSSCATRLEHGEGEYFQNLGRDGELVVTVDVDRNADLLQTSDETVRMLMDRSTRISVAVGEDENGNPTYNGVLEGKFPTSLVNMALKLSGSFEKGKSRSITYFRDPQSGMELLSANSSAILFSSSSVMDTFARVSSTDKAISDEQSSRLVSSQIGLYVSRPENLEALALDLPQALLDSVVSILVTIDDGFVCMDFVMVDEKNANTLSILVKAGYVSQLILDGAKPDVQKLKNQFILEADSLLVRNVELTVEQSEMIKDLAARLLEMI